jgi:predicted dinucleotide-binding enzyme
MIKIGILGSGVVAKVLAAGFIKYGYEVMLGSRDVSKLASWQLETGAWVGTFEETADFGEIIVLAVKGNAAKSALEIVGADRLNGKTVIDTTNPIADLPPVNGVIQFFTTLDRSLMEDLQLQMPEVNFVKSFSCVGNPFMVDPDFDGTKPTMFICGNNDSAKKDVEEILVKFGWDTEDMGKVEAARAIEPLCMLWCIPGMLSNSWSHAFKLLKK